MTAKKIQPTNPIRGVKVDASPVSGSSRRSLAVW